MAPPRPAGSAPLPPKPPPSSLQQQQQAAKPPPPQQQQQQAKPKPTKSAEPLPPTPQPGPGADFGLLEQRTGLRLSWHLWPRTAAEADMGTAAPFGLLYSPLKDIDRLYRLECEPVRCAHCGAVLSPFSHVEPQSGRWNCGMCNGWNQLPPRLASATSMPDELKPEHATIEYELPPDAPDAPRASCSSWSTARCRRRSREPLQETLSQVSPRAVGPPVGLVTFAEEVDRLATARATPPRPPRKVRAAINPRRCSECRRRWRKGRIEQRGWRRAEGGGFALPDSARAALRWRRRPSV